MFARAGVLGLRRLSLLTFSVNWRRYTDCGRAPRLSRLSVVSRVEPIMPSRVDHVALSLLPASLWAGTAERLRQGHPAADILLDQCARAALPGGRSRKKRSKAVDPEWALEQAQHGLQDAEKRGIQSVVFDDAAYPQALREIAEPPPVLWVKGQAALLARTAVAVVGSRAGSPYAISVAERLAADLAGSGVVVVSGLARGVDSAAHRGALSNEGATVAVLGCGVDIVYPSENGALMGEIAGSGAIVSELLPGTVPQPVFFPRRNRIISGLAKAVVVVEAGEKSGSLITARFALEQGRDVLAVPGNVLNGRNKGGHALLRDGARIVESVADILEELGTWPHVAAACAERDADVDPILKSLPVGDACGVDEIAARSMRPIAEILPRLLQLELEGVVTRQPGGLYLRCKRIVLG
jgi:DNA processing protein